MKQRDTEADLAKAEPAVAAAMAALDTLNKKVPWELTAHNNLYVEFDFLVLLVRILRYLPKTHGECFFISLLNPL